MEWNTLGRDNSQVTTHATSSVTGNNQLDKLAGRKNEAINSIGPLLVKHFLFLEDSLLSHVNFIHNKVIERNKSLLLN